MDAAAWVFELLALSPNALVLGFLASLFLPVLSLPCGSKRRGGPS